MDSHEGSIGARTGLAARKRRKLSPTGRGEPELLEASDPSNIDSGGQKIGRRILPSHSDNVGYPTDSDRNKQRYELLACGCNLYGQLISDREWAIADDVKETDIKTDWSEHANSDALVEAAREPSLFVTVDTPTVVMTARKPMRVLYLGNNSICVEREDNIYLRGLQATLTPGSTTIDRELPVPLPPGVHASQIKRGFGTRWAFLGLILSSGHVYSFSLTDWSFKQLICEAMRDAIDDIQINRVGELCFLYSHYTASFEQATGRGISAIGIYPPIPSITEHLHDASLQHLELNEISPISFIDSRQLFNPDTLSEEGFESIAATSTGFLALTSSGNVFTYGDGRFNSLGRSPYATIGTVKRDVEDPTTEPFSDSCWGQVVALGGIVVKQISANPGGFLQVALAEDGTAYLWGGDGTENIRISSSGTKDRDEDEDVSMIEITGIGSEEQLEFESAAVGEDHIVLLEKGRKGVWVSGGGDMGQTGFGVEYRCLPTALKADVEDDMKGENGIWRRWNDEFLGDRKIVRVLCGFGCTLLVSEIEN